MPERSETRAEKWSKRGRRCKERAEIEEESENAARVMSSCQCCIWSRLARNPVSCNTLINYQWWTIALQGRIVCARVCVCVCVRVAALREGSIFQSVGHTLDRYWFQWGEFRTYSTTTTYKTHTHTPAGIDTNTHACSSSGSARLRDGEENNKKRPKMRKLKKDGVLIHQQQHMSIISSVLTNIDLL